jgi:hypothetical protein
MATNQSAEETARDAAETGREAEELRAFKARVRTLVERRRMLTYVATATIAVPVIATMVVSRDALAQTTGSKPPGWMHGH